MSILQVKELKKKFCYNESFFLCYSNKHIKRKENQIIIMIMTTHSDVPSLVDIRDAHWDNYISF